MDDATMFRPLSVTAPDGVSINGQVWGDTAGPEIVFVHGMLQSHLSWLRQVHSPLARNCHLVTYDFRGHGGSGMPFDPTFYNDSSKFADELKAVIDGAGLKRPTLVGWSFGTRILADYLLKYGASGIAGINFVAAAISPISDHYGPAIKKLVEARDPDFATSIRGSKNFLRACFAVEPTRDEFETMLVYNAAVPLPIRRWFGRSASDTDAVQTALRALTVPVLITHGLQDQVVLPELSRWLGELTPNSRVSLFSNSGHAPFFEEAERFNRELGAFVGRQA